MNNSENYILITGGAGFIGSHVVERLSESGEDIILVDNFDPFLYDTNIKKKNIESILKKPNVTLSITDLRSSQELETLFKTYNVSKVIHLSARAGVRPSIKYPLEYEEYNVKATINLLENCRKYDVKSLVFASSSSVYGGNKKIPFSETDSTDSAISPYGSSKKACEVYCYTYSHIYSLPITCLRYFTVYGPRQRPEMAIHLFTRLIDEGKPIYIFGDGTSKRDYTYISDIVTGTISALETPFKYEIINLGNSNPVELRYLISLIEKELNKKALIIKKPSSLGDPEVTFADTNKAQRLLNYVPEVKIEEGIAKFMKWYRELKREQFR